MVEVRTVKVVFYDIIWLYTYMNLASSTGILLIFCFLQMVFVLYNVCNCVYIKILSL